MCALGPLQRLWHAPPLPTTYKTRVQHNGWDTVQSLRLLTPEDMAGLTLPLTLTLGHCHLCWRHWRTCSSWCLA